MSNTPEVSASWEVTFEPLKSEFTEMTFDAMIDVLIEAICEDDSEIAKVWGEVGLAGLGDRYFQISLDEEDGKKAKTSAPDLDSFTNAVAEAIAKTGLEGKFVGQRFLFAMDMSFLDDYEDEDQQ